jgi:DNA-directed RNA polymerase subunit RPC12/RpoP
MADTTCSTCGKALAQPEILYNTSGNVVCLDCSTKAEIKGDEGRAARNIKIAAFTCLGTAVVSFLAFGVGFGLGFWPAAIAAVASGVFAINGIAGPGAEKFVAYLSKTDKTLVWVCTAIGFAFIAYEVLAMGGAIHFKPWVH